jgi:hypothetical protein
LKTGDAGETGGGAGEKPPAECGGVFLGAEQGPEAEGDAKKRDPVGYAEIGRLVVEERRAKPDQQRSQGSRLRVEPTPGDAEGEEDGEQGEGEVGGLQRDLVGGAEAITRGAG